MVEELNGGIGGTNRIRKLESGVGRSGKLKTSDAIGKGEWKTFVKMK